MEKEQKFTKRFVGSYKVKKIVLTNTVELQLPSTVKIHPVVNFSRICRYVGQIEGQKKKQLASVIIKEEEKWYKRTILSRTSDILVVAHQSDPALIK